MTEDFLNGLSVVSLNANHSFLSSIEVSDVHPWRDLYQIREPPPAHSSKTLSSGNAPLVYTNKEDIIGPQSHWVVGNVCLLSGATKTRRVEQLANIEVEWHETIRLCDVEAFRKSTAEKARENANLDTTNGLSAGISRLSPSSPSTRPVIYRYIDVIKDSFALLEAIHFELFLPERADLRFLAVPCTAVPSDTLEGHYFHVHDVDLLTNPSFAVILGKVKYPVIWEMMQYQRIECGSNQDVELVAYIVKKKVRRGGETAINNITDGEFFIREKLFPDQESRNEHSLVRVTMRKMATAQLYSVEPVCPSPKPPTYDEQIKIIDALSEQKWAALKNAFSLLHPETQFDGLTLRTHLKDLAGKPCLEEALCRIDSTRTLERKYRYLRRLHFLGCAFGWCDVKEPDPRIKYLQLIDGVRSSSQRTGLVASAVRALDAADNARIEDRLSDFTNYGEPGDLKLMNRLFQFGCRYRVFASSGMSANDVGETKMDESIVLKTLLDKLVGTPEKCRPLLDCIYGRSDFDDAAARALATAKQENPSVVLDFGRLILNAAQSTAVRLYLDEAGPLVFCILSPPGSGKTTVAAAMAAEFEWTRARKHYEVFCKDSNPISFRKYDTVQLLLAVQNVAVDNIGAALKKMGIVGRKVYNMKTSKRLNPYDPAPYDFFDQMSPRQLNPWLTGTVTVPSGVLREQFDREKFGKRRRKTKKFSVAEECVTHFRREYERGINAKIILSTVDMLLQKMYTESSLVDDLEKVTKIIIDEASLLTEAALFAVIRRFPKARIVLIGDDKQLPPFQYADHVLGHELAGRPALSVAMKTGRVPVVELSDVYRAPPSLVAPYNRLAYDGRLVSKKAEGRALLSEIGLLHYGSPQLLLIDVDGIEKRNGRTMSFSNAEEVEVVVRLLNKFPRLWTKFIMIICLYKEQRKRLQERLNKQDKNEKYTILTVDSAQGKEAPIVIVLTTRTQRATDFFRTPERCNVSVSRQQQALIILGKAHLLTTITPWSTVVNGGDFTYINADDIK